MFTAPLFATEITEPFEKYFEIDLPENHRIEFGGGKVGESLYTLYKSSNDYVFSFFVSYPPLDPRKWGNYEDKENYKFMYVEGDVFVYADIPSEFSKEEKDRLWTIMKSIKRIPNQSVDTTPTSAPR